MAYACGREGMVRLWSPRVQRQVGVLRGLSGAVRGLGFSADGRLLAVADGSRDGCVSVWDVGGASSRAPLSSSPSTVFGGLALRHAVEVRREGARRDRGAVPGPCSSLPAPDSPGALPPAPLSSWRSRRTAPGWRSCAVRPGLGSGRAVALRR
jgi:WD40 repeat protein